MKYALILDSENRIIDFIPSDGAPEEYPVVDEETLPKGEISNYKYVDDEYVYDPLLWEEPEPEPTAEDMMNAMLRGLGYEQ